MSKFSLLVTWYGNDLKRTTLLNGFTHCLENQTLPRSEFEVILVRDGECLPVRLETLVDKELVLPHRVFNRAWFINCGARAATSKWLMILDADLLFGTEFFNEVVKYMATTTTYVFIPFNHAVWQDEDGSSRIIDYRNKDYFGLAYCIKKDEFFKHGGICESFFGYGGEDEEIGWKHRKNKEYMNQLVVHPFHARNQIIYEDSLRLIDAIRNNREEMERRQVLVKDKIGNPREPVLVDFRDLARK